MDSAAIKGFKTILVSKFFFVFFMSPFFFRVSTNIKMIDLKKMVNQ